MVVIKMEMETVRIPENIRNHLLYNMILVFKQIHQNYLRIKEKIHQNILTMHFIR